MYVCPSIALLALFGVTGCTSKAPHNSEPVAQAAAHNAANAQGRDAPSCPHEGAKQGHNACDPSTPLPPTKKQGHLGESFKVASALTLAKALKREGLGSTPVRVKGTIGAVCQKRGCWLVLQDQDMQARVMVKQHAFSFPFGAKGQHAEIEGELRRRKLSEGQVRHLQADGDSNLKAKGPREEFFIFATAAQISP